MNQRPKSRRTDRLAVLIDADNASAKLIVPLLAEIAKYGVASVKRVYGDWTKAQLNGWKEVLIDSCFQPIQQFAYTTGKNSTDSTLIIDAMDLLYTKKFEGFCIVSSDSDFTRLACRIREAGLTVYGFGQEKTPSSFVRACDKFIFVEILHKVQHATDTQGNQENQPKEGTKREQDVRSNRILFNMLKNAYEAYVGDDGWASLGAVGSQLVKVSPSFDPRNYGYAKLSGLIKATGWFDVEAVANGTSGAKHWRIKRCWT